MGRKALVHVRRHAVGYLALSVALSGVAYAATAPRNSVKSSSIKNGQVKTRDLGSKAVASAKLKDGAVTEAKLGDGAVSEDKLGVPLDFVPAANVTRIQFTGSNCALETDPSCTANPQVPFLGAGIDNVVITCSNNGGDGARLNVAVFKDGGRVSSQITRDGATQVPTIGTGAGALINGNEASFGGPNGVQGGSFVATAQTEDEARTVTFTGNYTINANQANAAVCTIDGVAIGT